MVSPPSFNANYFRIKQQLLAVRGSSVTGEFHMAVEHQAVATFRMRGAAFELGRGGADGIREINIHGQFHFGCAAG